MYITECYALSYDAERNQITWKIRGAWMSPKVKSEILAHWDWTFAQARKPGFTVLADFIAMEAEQREIEEVWSEICEKMITLGVRKIATVISILAKAGWARKLQDNEMRVGVATRNFYRIPDAQAWLDE